MSRQTLLFHARKQSSKLQFAKEFEDENDHVQN